jgi:hypothetical protein
MRLLKFLGAVALACSIAMSASAPASAQVTIEIGASDAQIKSVLARQGYNRVEVVERGLSSTTLRACRGANRVELKYYWDGRISDPRRIGGCRDIVTRRQIEDVLTRQGYERISFRDIAAGWAVSACRAGNRVRIEVSRFGDVSPERRIGRCEAELTPDDITPLLEAQGYDRVVFTDDKLPGYVAQACFGLEKREIVFDRFGRPASAKRVGTCPPPISVEDIPGILAADGYDRIGVIETEAPYLVEACKGLERREIRMDRYGLVIQEDRTGRCTPPINSRQLSDALARQGYQQVTVTDRGADGFLVNACYAETRFELTFSRFGEVTNERNLGRCRSMSVKEILDSLSQGGLRDAQMFVEGCQRGRRVRVLIDAWGNEAGREAFGRC